MRLLSCFCTCVTVVAVSLGKWFSSTFLKTKQNQKPTTLWTWSVGMFKNWYVQKYLCHRWFWLFKRALWMNFKWWNKLPYWSHNKVLGICVHFLDNSFFYPPWNYYWNTWFAKGRLGICGLSTVDRRDIFVRLRTLVALREKGWPWAGRRDLWPPAAYDVINGSALYDVSYSLNLLIALPQW